MSWFKDERPDVETLRAVLSDSLLRSRDPRGIDRYPSFRDIERYPTLFGVAAAASGYGWHPDIPLVGVASTEHNGSPRIVLLMSEENEFNAAAFGKALEVGYPIDAVVSGEITPAARPAQGGDSISGDGDGGQTGTFGCVVLTSLNEPRILGCNHTLAGVNRCTHGQDKVRQPGAADGGQPTDEIGLLSTFHPIIMGCRHPNIMDAAIAEPDDRSYLTAGVRGVGAIRPATGAAEL